MTQEEQDLLFKDLCARLPYRPKCQVTRKGENGIYTVDITLKKIIERKKIINATYFVCQVKPYLRPLSSMTEKERKEFLDSVTGEDDNGDFHIDECMGIGFYQEKYDWLNSHYFDYRGLIEKGLAIEVSEDYKPYKQRIEEL